MSNIKILFGSGVILPGSSDSDTFTTVDSMFSVTFRKWNPSMDIYETEEEIIVLAEIAGVEKENLEVEVNSKALCIRGVRICQAPLENANYKLAEIFYGPFERTIFLPRPVDVEKVAASYVNGFLKITLKKQMLNQIVRIPITIA